MQKNNLAPSNQATDQWLINIYQQEFVALKSYAVSIVHNEPEAEDIVGQCFSMLAREFRQDPNKFSSSAHAKAFLATVIRNDCCSWLRKKLPANTSEPVEAIADDHSVLFEFEKHDLLQHLLPLFFREDLTMEEVEQRLHLNKDVLREYKSGVITGLHEIAFSKRHTLSLG